MKHERNAVAAIMYLMCEQGVKQFGTLKLPKQIVKAAKKHKVWNTKK